MDAQFCAVDLGGNDARMLSGGSFPGGNGRTSGQHRFDGVERRSNVVRLRFDRSLLRGLRNDLFHRNPLLRESGGRFASDSLGRFPIRSLRRLASAIGLGGNAFQLAFQFDQPEHLRVRDFLITGLHRSQLFARFGFCLHRGCSEFTDGVQFTRSRRCPVVTGTVDSLSGDRDLHIALRAYFVDLVSGGLDLRSICSVNFVELAFRGVEFRARRSVNFIELAPGGFELRSRRSANDIELVFRGFELRSRRGVNLIKLAFRGLDFRSRGRANLIELVFRSLEVAGQLRGARPFSLRSFAIFRNRARRVVDRNPPRAAKTRQRLFTAGRHRHHRCPQLVQLELEALVSLALHPGQNVELGRMCGVFRIHKGHDAFIT